MSEAGAPIRLHDALRRGDARGREVETALAVQLHQFALMNGIDPAALIRALMGQFVAVIFAKSSGPAEAREAAEACCAEIMRRVTAH